MINKLMLATVITMVAGAASAADLYAIDAENCFMGAGGEGNIEIGSGVFSIGERPFSRISDRIDEGNGYFKASYSEMAEGEAVGQMNARMMITDEIVEIIFADSQRFVAERCR